MQNFVDVYTYIASETFFRAEDLKNALIVNIKVNWLFDALHASSDPQDIMILDHQGNIIGHSLQEGFLQNIGDQPYVQKILNHGSSSGYFMTDLHDMRTVVTFVSLDFPEWIFISITPYATAATTIQRVQMITGLIFILVLLFGIAITYFLSKNLYSPVDSLRHKIESLAGHVPTKGKASDEFDMISDHLFSTSVELHNLKLFKNSNATLLRNEFLKNLLFQSETCSNDFYKKWDNYSIQLSLPMSTLLFILKIDQYVDFCRLHTNFDQSLYRFALRNICMEVISESFACECISMDNDHLVTLLSVPDPMDIDSLHSTLQQGIQRIQQMFSQYFKVSLSCFISQPTDDLGELPLLYEDTLDLSKYRIKFGHQCILTQDSLRQYSIDFFDIKNENFDKLLSALRNENLDEAQSHLAVFIELLYHASYTTIDFALSYLSTSIFNMLALLEANSAIQFEIDFVSFNTMVERLETLADIQSAYIHLFENIIYRIHGYKDQKSEVVIETVIQYIDNHYMDSNLYAEQLGALVNLSPSYLNKLFRKHTSQSISNYIKEIRLLRAQDLLLKTNDTIEEIADQIGWENKQYFYSVFKKNFGVTPTEYRSKNKTGDLL